MQSPMSIYMPKIRSVGLLAGAGEVVTHERTDGWTERITDHYYGFSIVARSLRFKHILSRASEVGSATNHPGLQAATRHGVRDRSTHD